MAFEVATYTDVSASEAVDGVDGFNFQSVSPGVTGLDQQRIRENLLHRVVPSWALDHGPLTHPATCAYVVRDGRFYLSRGKSTGDTTSGRPGNQLTQVIVTSDPDDFVPYRPAQLYGAVGWTLEKSQGTASDPWVTPLEIRPEFEVSALEKLITLHEWAASILPHYLTMIDAAVAAEPTKLVLLHSDLDVVMQWIALGTLFVDADVARVLHFRALVDDPWRADAALVGVSPDFLRSDLSAANVLDLTGQSLPDIEPSDSARVRASWFLELGADDALITIEIARRWERTLGAELANEAARVVGLPEAVTTGPSAWYVAMAATERLAAAGLRDDLALYAQELCEATFGYGPTSAEEFSLAGRAIRSAHDLAVDELASGVLVPTLEALTAVPTSARDFAREFSGCSVPVQWEGVESRGAASAFMGNLLNCAPTDQLAGLFTAAEVIAAPVAEPALRTAAQRLAAAWVKEPALGRDTWQSWLAGQVVLDAMVHELVETLRSGDYATLTQLYRGEWDFIGPHTYDASMQGWLKAARLSRIPAERRADQVRRTTGMPAEAWRVALAGSRIPEHARLWATWIIYSGLAPDMGATLKAEIRAAQTGDPNTGSAVQSAEWHPLMYSLAGSSDPELVGIGREFNQAYSALKRSRDAIARRPEARLEASLPHLVGLAPLLLPDIGWLLVNTSNSEDFQRLLEACAPWGPAAIRRSIVDLATTNHALHGIERALSLRNNANEAVAGAADAALAEVFESHPGLVEVTKSQTHLGSEIEKYQQLAIRAYGGKRGLGDPFGRNKEKQHG